MAATHPANEHNVAHSIGMLLSDCVRFAHGSLTVLRVIMLFLQKTSHDAWDAYT